MGLNNELYRCQTSAVLSKRIGSRVLEFGAKLSSTV